MKAEQSGVQVLQAFLLTQGIEFIAVIAIAISAGPILVLINVGMLILLNILVKVLWHLILDTHGVWRFLLYCLVTMAPLILGYCLIRLCA